MDGSLDPVVNRLHWATICASLFVCVCATVAAALVAALADTVAQHNSAIQLEGARQQLITVREQECVGFNAQLAVYPPWLN